MVVAPRIGDVLEICTTKGLAYAQSVNKHNQYGALIRVFKGLHDKRPDNVDLVINAVQFVCFLPVQAAVHQGIMAVVGNVRVPKDASVFPCSITAQRPSHRSSG